MTESSAGEVTNFAAKGVYGGTEIALNKGSVNQSI
jgi:hypothetical protein